MGSGNFNTKVEEILEKVDIVEVVSEYVKLKKCGKSYKSLCPFHPEKTPSFFVHPEKQIFHCFGCGIGGNVIKFLMNIEKISFYEALKLLANRIGIEISKSEDLRENPERKRLIKTNEYVANLYNKVLFSNIGKRALEYLYNRNLTEDDINRFLLGFAPSNNFLLKHIENERLNKEDFILAALINEEGDEDTFKNRIIFPIFNIKNEIIGFGGRTIEEDVMPKYLNIRENLLFNKSAVLYGINWAKEEIKNKGFVILTEGYFDVLKMYINGYINAVAPMGTAITELHLNTLKKLTDKILLLFDGDDAGIRGCLRNLENILKNGFETKICMLPSGFDPDKFLDEYGSTSLQNFMEKAQDFVDFSISINSQIYNPENPKEKAIIVKETIKLIANIPDEIEKYEYLKKLANKMDIKIEILEETLKKIMEENLIEEEKYMTNYDFQTNEEILLLEIALCDEKYMEKLFEYKGKLTDKLEKVIQAGESLIKKGFKINPSLLINECEDGEISSFISSVAIKEFEISDSKKEKIFNDCLKKIKRKKILEEVEICKKKINEKIEKGEDYKEELENMQKLLYQLKKEG